MVSEEDVKKQESRVKEIRKHLENLFKEYNELRMDKSSTKNLMQISNGIDQ